MNGKDENGSGNGVLLRARIDFKIIAAAFSIACSIGAAIIWATSYASGVRHDIEDGVADRKQQWAAIAAIQVDLTSRTKLGDQRYGELRDTAHATDARIEALSRNISVLEQSVAASTQGLVQSVRDVSERTGQILERIGNIDSQLARVSEDVGWLKEAAPARSPAPARTPF